ncbi:MAG TPA: chorismate synthase [Firmicutes bacterium]|nr:chorismate synthase [Bacillota bacterium]
MLRFLTAGESHGPGITAILEGMPAGIPVSLEELRHELKRRRWCYGRGGRATIEGDVIEVTGGIHKGRTTGAPVSIFIPNADHPNWIGRESPVFAPRPGHADLAGAIKYGFTDCRPIAERASARETAARVACGYFAKKLLALGGISIYSWVTRIGPVSAKLPAADERMYRQDIVRSLAEAAEKSPVRCPDPDATSQMMSLIDEAKKAGDTLGGVFEVSATGVPVGLGSHVHWDRRLDTRVTAAVMSIPGVKAVEIGLGIEAAIKPGSQVHDEILPGEGPIPVRNSNRAGGIEGGISNGEVIFVRAALKPIPTLQSPLRSVNLSDRTACPAHAERSDVCAVGSAAVVAEAMLALTLADAWLERFGEQVNQG